MKEPEQTPLFDVTEYSPQGEEWHDMPEYVHEDLMPWKQIVVSFESEADMNAFAKAVGQKITVATKSIWYPELTIRSYSDKRYASHES